MSARRRLARAKKLAREIMFEGLQIDGDPVAVAYEALERESRLTRVYGKGTKVKKTKRSPRDPQDVLWEKGTKR